MKSTSHARGSRSIVPSKKPKTNATVRRSTRELAMKALSDTRYLKGLVNSERHYTDTTIFNDTSFSTVNRAVNISQGDAKNSRSGNTVLVRSINLHFDCFIDPIQTVPQRLMVALVQDLRQRSDTAPTVSDVFEGDQDPSTFLNISHAGRFKILLREDFILTPNNGGRPYHYLSKYMDANFHLKYNGASFSDLESNGLWWITITSGANPVTKQVRIRVGYHDN